MNENEIIDEVTCPACGRNAVRKNSYIWCQYCMDVHGFFPVCASCGHQLDHHFGVSDSCSVVFCECASFKEVYT